MRPERPVDAHRRVKLLTLFATALGSALAFLDTTIVIVALPQMEEDMDLDCGEILEGTCSIPEMGRRIFARLLATASGERTKSEALGMGDHEFLPWQIGVVG